MAKKGHKISHEIKDQIISRIKHNGVSVSEAAKDAGISTGTIYSWLGMQARGTISVLEHNKLKKENQQLKELIGEITLRLSEEQKKG
jgi:transposase-like protein